MKQKIHKLETFCPGSKFNTHNTQNKTVTRYKIVTSRFGINTSELISKVCSSLDHHSLVELC